MNPKYPKSLFLTGFMLNLVFKFSYLFIPAIVLVVIGLFFRPCMYIGFVLFCVDVIVSLIQQLKIRKTFMALADCDNPDFESFVKSVSNSDNWRNGVKSFVEQKIDNCNEED